MSWQTKAGFVFGTRAFRATIFALAMLIGGIGAFRDIAPGQVAQSSTGVQPVVHVKLKGAIGFVAVELLDRAIQRAERERATALVVQLDTPGGLVTSTREMIQSILASRVPVVFFVAPSGARAASAGTFLLYASHVAAMAPGTHLGAATPIPLGMPGMPGQPSKPKEPNDKEKDKSGAPGSAGDRKSLNDAIAYIRTLAQLRGRNAAWAEKAVRDAATLTADEAVKENVIDLLSPTLGDLVVKLDGRRVTTADGTLTISTKGSPVIEVVADWKMKVMSAIADPNIAFILFLIGIYGIIFEFMNPGTIGPGVIGAICLLLAMTALSVLPVTAAGLALIVLGILLMIGEAAAPGLGVLGIGGTVALILGALFLFDPDAADIPYGVAWPVIAGAALTTAALMIGVIGLLYRSRQKRVTTGDEDLIGSTAVVESWSGVGGRVRVHGESWQAVSGRVPTVGETVKVKARDGLVLAVE